MDLDSKNICPVCKKKKKVKKILGIEFFISNCQCEDKNIDEYEKGKEIERLRCKYENCNIPVKYQNDKLNDWISKTEIKPMEKIIKNYYKNMKGNIANGIGIILAGTIGSGKTRILCWLASRIILETDFTLYFITVSELIVRINLKQERKWFSIFKNIDVLILDDFSEIDLTDSGKTALSTIVNGRYNNKKSTFITTMKDVEKINFMLGEHTLSRLIEMAKDHIVEIESNNMRYKEGQQEDV